MPRCQAVLRSSTVLALLPIFVVTSACCPNTREAKKQGDTLMLSEPAATKVDPEVRRSASQLLAEGRGEELMPVLVRVTGTEAREKLQAAGMSVESMVGDVASGKIPARALADVAALDAVIQVQPAHELEIK